jgi:hypothetical protein
MPETLTARVDQTDEFIAALDEWRNELGQGFTAGWTEESAAADGQENGG